MRPRLKITPRLPADNGLLFPHYTTTTELVLMKVFGLLMLLALQVLVSCTNSVSSDTPAGPTQVDVKIGDQVWMTQNLDVGVFRNGDTLRHATTDAEWDSATHRGEPVWCYYNNDASNAASFGRLYNWYAVTDPRGLAPTGYHVPSDAEWQALVVFLGGDQDAGGSLKSSYGWSNNGNGTNSSGFFAMPGGSRRYDGNFSYFGSFGNWWSATADDSTYAWARNMASADYDVNRYSLHKTKGLSVRCVKD